MVILQRLEQQLRDLFQGFNFYFSFFFRSKLRSEHDTNDDKIGTNERVARINTKMHIFHFDLAKAQATHRVTAGALHEHHLLLTLSDATRGFSAV